MNYTKPEVAALGDAVQVIQSLHTKTGMVYDGTQQQINPAYDLDE
jgi:hypothetical protein